MTSNPDLPSTHRALVLRSTSVPLEVETIPTPQPTSGSVVVRILSAGIISYMRDVYNGKRSYPFPMPLVTGSSAIGRVAAIGPDTTSLKPGQLVYVDCVVRGRDDPGAIFLLGLIEGATDGSRKLMHGEWRDATYAEYAKIPLENCEALDEHRLLGDVKSKGLGYSVEELAFLGVLLVPYGGLRDIDLKSGETVVISPATGQFGGGAVLVALAMGARVIAMGRNKEALERLSAHSDRIETVPITGDVEAETNALRKFGTIDAFFDISPPVAEKSTHIKSAILSLRHGGRVSFMSGFREDLAIPFRHMMHGNIQVKAKWMYERSDMRDLVKMLEVGTLKIGPEVGQKVCGSFPLEDWKKAFDVAAENAAFGEIVVLKP